MYDELLLVLSANSIESEWVKTEIAMTRQREKQEERRKLFPIRLVDMATLQAWQCFDADTGKDSAREIREYYIPDFSKWRAHDRYQLEFEKLFRDLKPPVPEVPLNTSRGYGDDHPGRPHDARATSTPRLERVEVSWRMRRLQKATRFLECGIYRTDTGFEVRAGYGLEDLLHTRLCATIDDARDCAEKLRQTMIAKGGFEELSSWDPEA